MSLVLVPEQVRISPIDKLSLIGLFSEHPSLALGDIFRRVNKAVAVSDVRLTVPGSDYACAVDCE